MIKHDNITKARKAIAARRIKLERAKLPARVRAKMVELGMIERDNDGERVEYR